MQNKSGDNSVTLQLNFVAGLTGAEYESDWSHQERVYFSAVGRSFFEQCFPRNSVHVGFRHMLWCTIAPGLNMSGCL